MLITCAALTSCGGDNSAGDPVDTLEVHPSTDKYRNYYEIFVTSFCDSDDDGFGDLQGIISKLDYLNDGDPTTDTDLGIDGIWLTPIMPSASYHKYDVDDYFNIDSAFGTLDDFDQLVKQCHKRGIKLIIDMVLNHCSSYHPLFKSACKQALEGNLDGDARYFEIAHYDENPGDAYTSIGKGYYYESNFSPRMPEWNLNEKCTRDYFSKISKFWLKDHDVDGFRLDATLYYTNSHTDGKEFLKWFYSDAKKIKSDVYMVGEEWSGNADIIDMYESGADSFFSFNFAGPSGGFMEAARNGSAPALVSQLKRYEEYTKQSNSDAINCYFLSNHDQIRSANYISGVGASGVKMAAALYMLLPGNSFIYYGEELGLSQDGSQNADEYKREPMIWDSEKLPEINVGGVTKADESQCKYGGAKQQSEDSCSILSFYRRLIKIKNQNPEIARGTIDENESGDDSVMSCKLTSGDTTLLVYHNLSQEEERTVELSGDAELRGTLIASDNAENNSVSLDGKSLKLPAYSTAVLKLK